MQTMLISKLKLGAMVILLFVFAVTTAGLAIPQAPPEKQPKNKAESPAPARSARDKQVRKDRYGDPLPPGAIARLGTLRLRHQGWTTSAVFTRDGKTAIVGDSYGFIHHWDVATGRQVRRPQKMVGGSYALAITADGKTLASGYGGQLYLWDVASGQLLSQAVLNGSYIPQMLFTPDGKTLALRTVENTIHLWDTVGNKKLHELKGGKGGVSRMAVSPDGKTLASVNWKDPDICLWDIATGKEKLHFVADDEGVAALAFSPDGKTLALIGNQPSFAFFDPNTGKRLRTVKDYAGGLNAIAYSPDGKTLIAIGSHTVHSHTVHSLDAASGKSLRKFDVSRRSVTDRLTVSPDGKTVAVFGGGLATFDLWDVAGGKLLHSFVGHRNGVASLAFSADGATLFASAKYNDFGLHFWDATTGELRGQISDIPLPGDHGLALSPDGKLLAASGRAPLRLLDPVSRKVVRSCIGCKGDEDIETAAWSADGKTLIASNRGSGVIHVWDPATGKLRRSIAIKQDGIGQIALSPDGAIAAVGCYWKGVVHLWATSSGKELRSIAIEAQAPKFPVAFSPVGTILACGGFGGISLWEPATGRLLCRWNADEGQLAFSSDGRTLVSAGIGEDAVVHLWETVTGKERDSFAGQRPEISVLAISRDGRRIASGSDDTTILVWDATAGARPNAALSAEQLRMLWRDLGDTDARRAYRVLWQLALSPKHALPFLAEKLPPVAPLDAARQKQVDLLLADLDSVQFAVRQEAETELEKMGSMVEPALRKTLENKPSREMRRRIESVLAKWADERLRPMRALEAVEHMNTAEARRLLEALAGGVPHAWLTKEAQAIRKRLAEQSVTMTGRLFAERCGLGCSL
ncbi:MAG TPA: WD40 repeat domain-containing protein [Gemmataceae bacterium]|nr:WD40 repeat domain-containing protein [Gemmataceae bacterium]